MNVLRRADIQPMSATYSTCVVLDPPSSRVCTWLQHVPRIDTEDHSVYVHVRGIGEEEAGPEASGLMASNLAAV